MRSWSQPLPENPGPPLDPASMEGPSSEEAELRIMRRRFAEALRRAEIVSILASAKDEPSLGKALAEELCGAYDAEVGLLAETDAAGVWRPISLVGVPSNGSDPILRTSEVAHAVASSRAITERGSDLLGIGARTCLLASYRSNDGRHIVIGVARMYEQEFDEPETALLESVAVHTGRALERLWAHAERDQLVEQLKQAFIGTAEALANALEAKDDYTADHATEVANLAVLVGTRLGLGEQDLEDLRYAAIFHDIGKIAIPDAILQKPGPLDDAEREVMMTHPEIGARIVEPIPFLSDAVKTMVRHDHERFDGGGYPDGLGGTDIPLGARIILVVDSFHAMTSDRPYRKALTVEVAREELARHSGTQFDPEIVNTFLALLEEDPEMGGGFGRS